MVQIAYVITRDKVQKDVLQETTSIFDLQVEKAWQQVRLLESFVFWI